MRNVHHLCDALRGLRALNIRHRDLLYHLVYPVADLPPRGIPPSTAADILVLCLHRPQRNSSRVAFYLKPHYLQVRFTR